MSAEIRVFRCLSDNIGALIHDPATGACAAVDAPEEAPIVKVLEETGWTLSEIVVTHRHADHTQAIEPLKRRTGCRVVAPEKARGQVPAVDAYVGEGDTRAGRRACGARLGDARPLRRPRRLLVRGRPGAVCR
jgi:hydroxyacylglutathione hydrolase